MLFDAWVSWWVSGKWVLDNPNPFAAANCTLRWAFNLLTELAKNCSTLFSDRHLLFHRVSERKLNHHWSIVLFRSFARIWLKKRVLNTHSPTQENLIKMSWIQKIVETKQIQQDFFLFLSFCYVPTKAYVLCYCYCIMGEIFYSFKRAKS